MFVFVIMLVLIVIYVSVNFICVICEMLILDQYHWLEKILQEAREEVARRFLGPNLWQFGEIPPRRSILVSGIAHNEEILPTQKNFHCLTKTYPPNDLLDQKEKERPSKRRVGQKWKGRRARLPTEILGKSSLV